VPITLHSDLVRLTKLAKIGQTNLLDATKQCCRGQGASNPFLPFTTSLEELINGAAVNVSAIAEALVVNTRLAAAGLPVSKLAGRVLDNGGVKDCKV
jgi:hypothetical protein